jgi:hypothetical protein
MGDRNSGKKGSKPNLPSDDRFNPPEPRVDFGKRTPVFCLHHLQDGHDVASLRDKAAQAQFALTLHKCAKLTWQDIGQAGRHGNGTEWIPAGQVRAPIPEKFSDQTKFMAFRYNGKKPMLGVRINEVFHVLWIEREFGDVYPHD